MNSLINGHQRQYMRDIGYTPECAAIVQLFFKTGLEEIPQYLLVDYESAASEAINKGFVSLTDKDTLVLTNKATTVLKTILSLRESSTNEVH